jgi:hypothetical protein
MDEVKVMIGDAGQAIVTHPMSIEARCAELARSIKALTDVLTANGALRHLATCPEASQQEVFALLRALTREQAALTAALQRSASSGGREEAFRRAFRTGYSAGLQRTSNANGEFDVNDTTIRTSAGVTGGFQHGAWSTER